MASPPPRAVCARLLFIGVAIGLIAVAACSKKDDGPARTPSGAVASCSRDDECVVVASTGCCSCCPSGPLAIPKTEHERNERRCAAVDCKPCDPSIECAKVEKPEAFRAVCRDGTCAAEKR